MPTTLDEPTLSALKGFLEGHAKEQQAGNTIASLRVEIEAFRTDVDQRFALQGERQNRHNQRISRLEGTDMFDTGAHRGVDVDKKLAITQDVETALAAKEAVVLRENALWWKRSTIGWVAAGVGFILANAVAIFAAVSALSKK
jgi:FtsZ-binding cell division protein ZapB